MSEEFDIYGDLDNYNAEQTLKEKNIEMLLLQQKYKSSVETINDLQIENKELHKKIRNIERSFWSLLETAKLEVNRKDRQINELRQDIDNITFRRYNKNQPQYGERNVSNDLESAPKFQTKDHITFVNKNLKIFNEKDVSSSCKFIKKNDFHPEKELDLNKNMFDQMPKTVIKTNETSKFSSEVETGNADNIKTSEECIKSKLMEDVKKIRKKTKNLENEDFETNKAEHIVQNVEDLIFDEMLSDKRSLTIKNGSPNLHEYTENVLKNKEFVEYSQPTKSNTQDTESTEIEINSIPEKTRKIFSFEEKVREIENLNRNNRQLNKKKESTNMKIIDDSYEKKFKTMDFSTEKIENFQISEDNLQFSLENKFNDMKNQNASSADAQKSIDPKPHNRSEMSGFKFESNSHAANQSKSLETVDEVPKFRADTYLQNISISDKKIDSVNNFALSGDFNEVFEEDCNLNLCRKSFEKDERCITQVGTSKANKNVSASKNKNDKLVGHKIDGFEPKNTEKQVKEASKLKKTLFKEIIRGNDKQLSAKIECTFSNNSKNCVTDDQTAEISNKTFEKIEENTHKISNISPSTSNEETTVTARTSEAIDKTINEIRKETHLMLSQNERASKNEINNLYNNGLEVKNEITNDQSELNQDIQSYFEENETRMLHSEQENQQVSQNTQEIKQQLEKENNIDLKSKELIFETDKFVNNLNNLNEHSSKNDDSKTLNILKNQTECNQQNNNLERSYSKINILQNIQIAPPKKDVVIHDTIRKEQNDEQIEQNQISLISESVSFIDIKPKILKPDLKKILPLLDNSVEINKTATDQLVKILDNVPKLIQTSKDCNSKEKVENKSYKKVEKKSLPKIISEFLELSPNKFEIASEKTKNSDFSPNQCETLEAIKFLTDNLLTNNNENSPSKDKLKNLFNETPKKENFTNENAKITNMHSDKNKDLTEKENKKRNKKMKLAEESTRKSVRNMRKSKKIIEFNNEGVKLPKLKIFNLNFIQKSGNKEDNIKDNKKDYFIKEVDKEIVKESNIFKILENKEVEHKRGSKENNSAQFCGEEKLIYTNNFSCVNKENSMNSTSDLINVPIVELHKSCIQNGISTILAEQNICPEVHSKHNIPLIEQSIVNQTLNKSDDLREQIDEIFGKSPFNDAYLQTNTDISYENLNENNASDISVNRSDELNDSGDSSKRFSMAGKMYEMETDSTGIPIWNIKKQKNKRKKRELLDDESNDLENNNSKKIKIDDNYANSSKKIVTTYENKLSNKIEFSTNTTICKSSNMESISQSIETTYNLNCCSKSAPEKIKQSQKTFLSSYKIPKLKKNVKNENSEIGNNSVKSLIILQKEPVNHSINIDNNFKIESDKSNQLNSQNHENVHNISLPLLDSQNYLNTVQSTEFNKSTILKQFKSPQRVENDFNKTCNNDIEQEFLRIFGKSPTIKPNTEILDTENNCGYNFNNDQENLVEITPTTSKNFNCDNKEHNISDKNISLTENNLSNDKKCFTTSTKTYDMHYENDGTVMWVIKRKKKKKI